MTAFTFEIGKSGALVDLGNDLTLEACDALLKRDGLRCTLVVRRGGKLADSDKVNLTSDRSRGLYSKRLAERLIDIPNGLLLALSEAIQASQIATQHAPEAPVEDTEPWPDPVDGSALLTELVATIRRFVWLSEHKARAMALWIVHTHALGVASVTAILVFTSPQSAAGNPRQWPW